ncbi:MAG: four helix bundle protein [Saprospiraceae bacterium]|nr:four helix bundle protein [Saprospiraceae bacterium]
MRNFRELTIWKDAMDIVNDVYAILEKFPSSEKWGLSSQISRAAVSMPSNISEGCRGSDKELVYFLNIALGSSFELETQLEISFNQGYMKEDSFRSILFKLNTLQKQMNAFRTSIKYRTK